MKTPLARVLAFLLTLVLAVGHDPMRVAMVMPFAVSVDQMPPAAADMPGMDMSASGSGCCPSQDRDHGMRGAICGLCCAAAAQAVPPFHVHSPVRYAVAELFELSQSGAASQALPPDLPPPKA